MIIKQVNFMKSAADKSGFITSEKPIIAICGKSNVGKSSLINALSNRKNLARVSVSPGRTRLVNYFDFGEFILADLPGYGFAKVSKEEKDKWSVLMEDFFRVSKVDYCLSLVDIRFDPTVEDKQMIHFLYCNRFSFSVIATKADKIGKTRIKERVKSIGDCLGIGEQLVVPVSSETGFNKDTILDKIEHAINILKDEYFKPEEEIEDGEK